MNRQFTDGEIVAAIKAIHAEGARLSRAAVRKRLGGGGSTRISSLLKEYGAGPHGPKTRSGPTGPVQQSEVTGPTQWSGPSGPAGALTDIKSARPPTIAASPASAMAPAIEREIEGGVAHLESEIRVLKILLESERNARREEEARYARTIEALQREIETASRGWNERGAEHAARPSGTPGARGSRAKNRS